MLLQNVLFRCGGAAILLSNKWLDGRRALAKLMHCVRVQGVDDASYACVCPPVRSGVCSCPYYVCGAMMYDRDGREPSASCCTSVRT